jgi:GSCFA family
MRAYERCHPDLDVWSRSDGRLLDPFRPLIEPDGYGSIDALNADRIAHLAAVRRMLETLDVFVFTFGLTECWRSKVDGMVVPVAPGVAGGEWREDLYEFWNMRAGDVAADFVAFADLLRDVPPMSCNNWRWRTCAKDGQAAGREPNHCRLRGLLRLDGCDQQVGVIRPPIMQRWVGLGIIADNLTTIGRALAKPRAP